MLISLIVAVSDNDVIGADGGLPWHLPEDLQRFKALTMGKPMIMGRATYESIGRALPGRRSIILSQQANFTAAGCDVVPNTQAALASAGDVEEVMIIGGGAIYEVFLPQAKRIYLTRVHANIAGDTFFPNLDSNDWKFAETIEHPKTQEREYAYTYFVLDRKTTTDAAGSATPIDCDLHDQLEVACLYQYAVQVRRNDGTIVSGTATTTRTAGNVEYLIVTNNETPVEIPMTEIQRVKVLTPNARFAVIEFR